MEKKKKLSISLTTQILIATVGGIVFGAVVGPWASNLKFIGDIFIRLIQMSVILLVMSAVAAAVGSGDGQDVGKMGFHTFKWIIFFTIISASLGILLSMLVRPGVGIQIASAEEIAKATVESTSLQDTVLGFVSTNIIGSMADSAMVPCIVFALFFGVAMGAYTRQSGNRNMVEWVTGFNSIITNIIKTVMNIAPIGIFCLLADVAGSTGFKVIIPMMKFLGVLFIGDVIQFLIYGPLTATLCKVNPAKMPKKFAKMSMMAVTTTSGAICLPTKMEDAVTKFGVSRKVADFTGPITMSMNSCGAAMCYVVAIFFMAQSTGINLTIYQMGMAILLSCLMCMGTIVVPGGSVIVYTFLASSLGLPLESIAILIGIDWFSGMFRTLMNVDVDVMVGMLVANKLGELDRDVYNGKKEVTY
ncbi:dicarboxylate/amino acid:cation symporter [Bariatricus massiliensis]|uniref:Dicarboxylate/amino acid:cation symporter n=1 Tax=Bariatricus massiliensis TaxID=1745713 RepID=A0ABS8DJ59_9FIRM|nr:dicarboxylate/amino acid:cation symporter [Bariatricus massiliensis]MCB7305327.1 dicarboxylate/amino acid:cation symporter [Bariatricus massiliensis]MCB7375780.1 dicarboxylate/amino acid:cation symporter [Bariatricus massiliensis]MCB7388470.1 dicarboxylate/amino acid:cation symporter [Bariatricus massiliensis]MCB7412542.1 dicarboxylate/amino acid:cation symporter [Bariatricus massiliensis]MCQ5254820.1 dicarboxylate/amino acid:cation symporter [Bariatricus massiliensis]